MVIKDFLNDKAVLADLKSETKVELVEELIGLLVEAGSITSRQRKKVFEVLMARETLGSTAIGQGIAIPHGKCDAVKEIVGCLAVSKKGVNFDSLDGEPVHIFFLLLAPIDSAGPHLKALARISRLLKDKFVRDNLRLAENEKSILDLIRQEDDRLSKL